MTSPVLVGIAIFVVGISLVWTIDTIIETPWETSRSLTWNDFRGIPNPNSPYLAWAEGDLKYTYEWKTENSGTCKYRFAKAEAVAYFSKIESWVKEKGKTAALLKHEQGHFDILEIHAKKFNDRANRELLNHAFSCPGRNGLVSEGTINNAANAKVTTIFNQIKNEMKWMEKNYDTQTNHGFNSFAQDKWDSKIKVLLRN